MAARTRFTLIVALAALATLGPVGTVGAGGEDITRPERRIVVFAIPHVIWADLETETAPALRNFLDDAAVASVATRVSVRATPTDEGYATIGALTRAVAPGDTGAQAYGPSEPFRLGTAAQEYERRTGSVLTGAAALLTLPELAEANRESDFAGVVGTLGDLLSEAGYITAVIANADRPTPVPEIDGWAVHREAVTALMGTDGQVDRGRVDAGLLMQDADAAAGVRLDPSEVLASFDDAWQPGTIVLVEASDLARVRQIHGTVTPDRATDLHTRALADSDTLFAAVLDRVDSTRDVVVVVAPAAPASPHLTVFGIAGPGIEAGLLESAQTRLAGVITGADVGATIADLAGGELPDDVEGQPATVAGSGGGAMERHERMVGLDADARFRDGLVAGVTRWYVVAQIALVSAAAVLLHLRRDIRGLTRAGPALVALLPFTYLAALLDFESAGAGAWWVFVLGGGVALAGASSLLRPRPLAAIGLLSGAILVTLVASVTVFGSRLQLSTVFGDSPIVAGRFQGMNNLSFAQLGTAAIVLACLAVHRWPTRRGRVAAVTILGTALVVDVLPMWGADVGGILAGVPAFAVTATLLLGLRFRLRWLLGWGIGTAAAAVAVGLVDLSRPSADRTHLGRLFERIGADGADGLFLVVERKLGQNIRALTSQPWIWLVLTSILVAGYLVWRHGDRLRAVVEVAPEAVAAGWGLGVLAVLGFALNDSGVAVPGMILAVVNPFVLLVMGDRGAHPVDVDRAQGAAQKTGDAAMAPSVA